MTDVASAHVPSEERAFENRFANVVGSSPNCNAGASVTPLDCKVSLRRRNRGKGSIMKGAFSPPA